MSQVKSCDCETCKLTFMKGIRFARAIEWYSRECKRCFYFCSLSSKRFRETKSEERREAKSEDRPVILPNSLLQNRTETLATQAIIFARKLCDIGPDYMSRAGPVSRAALVWAGPVVM